MYRSPPLHIKELVALYGSRCSAGDEDGTSEDSESGEEARGGGGVRSCVSLEIHGLQREARVSFSNQEYYRRLEELKSTHLRNMAELERLKLQRINSQEELDFHETSSGSDQSELCGEDRMGDLELDNPGRTLGQNRTFTRDVLLGPDGERTQRHFGFRPKATSRQAGVGVWSSSKVTVPKPFKMMLREEERKKRRVRTRSEVELENSLLRRELEELRECQNRFRASPAPAHTRLPLYQLISCRPSQRPDWTGSRRGDRGTRTAPPQPFHFLERERKKREARIEAELGNLGRGDERRAFRARPVPGSVHGKRHRTRSETGPRPAPPPVSALEREATEGQSDQNSDPEPDAAQTDPCAAPRGSGRGPSTKPVKKQIELSIEMVQESEWSVSPV
ncbi:protein FAM161A-like isoform X2 [Betta splendens]|uniref:Protein FAM161A n=1 Tax=Betta splendens TaxID=158456 RepID=A0A9W2XA27_BETSP|nr:protein FAM161A-like isoform X2 [Betta splendens]